jgi:hypothetical protein
MGSTEHRVRRFFGFLGALCALLLVAFVLCPGLLDLRCLALLARSVSDSHIQLPRGCAETNNVEPGAVADDFEAQRKSRGVVFKAWIVCETADQATGFKDAFERDSRWLPSYVPGALQYRRTMIILANPGTAFGQSHLAAEICLMPWRRYCSQISGGCSTRFSIWQ